MATRFTRLLSLATSLGALALTRVPAATPVWAFVTLGACLAILGLAVFVTLRPALASPALRGAILAGTLALLLIPTSGQALLAGVPDWAVAVVLVVSLHLFFGASTMAAPTVGGGAQEVSGMRRMAAYVPFIATAAALILLPWTYAWFLPARIHSAYEFQGALTPLAPLAVLAAALVLTGCLRSWATRGAPSDEPADAGTAGPEGAEA